MSKLINMRGSRYGRLTALGFVGRKNKQSIWKFFCLCGTTKDIDGLNVRRGLVVSCGCYHRELQTRPTVHGHKDNGVVSPTYNSWRAMIGRCTHPGNNTFKFLEQRAFV